MAGVGLTVAVTGCSLFTSLSELSGDAAPDTRDAGDVRSEPRDAAVTDGDAGPPVTTNDATAPRQRFCATTDASVCEDWDDPKGSTWLDPPPNNALVVIDDAGATSLPASLLATSPPFDGGPRTLAAYRELRPTTRGTHFVEDLDVFVESRGTGSSCVIAALGFFEGGADYSTSLLLGENAEQIDENGPGNAYGDQDLGQRIRLNTWVHVRFDVRVLAMSNVKVTVDLDGQRVVERSLTTWNGFASGVPYLRNGIVYQNRPGAPWRFREDSIELRIE